jgi:flagellar hook-basal body complex protein FliE
MADPIQFSGVFPPIKSGVSGLSGAGQAGGAPKVEGKDFKSVLVDSLNEVNRLQTEADQGVQKLMTGESKNVAEVFAAVNKAGIAFDLLMEVRNKLTDAYQEIQQMRI